MTMNNMAGEQFYEEQGYTQTRLPTSDDYTVNV